MDRLLVIMGARRPLRTLVETLGLVGLLVLTHESGNKTTEESQ